MTDVSNVWRLRITRKAASGPGENGPARLWHAVLPDQNPELGRKTHERSHLKLNKLWFEQ